MLVPVNDMRPEGLEVDRTVHPVPGVESGGHPLELAPAHVEGRVQRVGLGYEFRGRIETSVHLPCSRCLEPFRLDLSLPFELVYRRVAGADQGRARNAPEGEMGDVAEDPGVSLLEVGGIDLGRLVEEQVYLALPLKPLCQTECRGLCPQCGAQWNRDKCDCKSDDVDPRWSALLELKKDMNGTGGRSR